MAGFPARQVTALIGPSGCGKSSYLALLQPDERSASTCARVSGDGCCWRARTMSPVPGTSTWWNCASGWAWSSRPPTPFPMSDLRQHRLRPPPAGAPRSRDRDWRRSVERSPAPGAALWDEVKDKLRQIGDGPFGRAAAAHVHRSRPRGGARSSADGRAVPVLSTLTRPSAYRGTDAGAETAEYTIVIVTHNMYQASRVSDYTGFFLLGELVEFGSYGSGLFESPAGSGVRTTTSAGRFG